ncbi:MAG: peptide chain release factor N(5)-glutamine methyltransferase [Rhodomicrobiaceae bacterium]
MAERATSLQHRDADRSITLHAAISALGGRFRAAGLSTPELDAKILALHACGQSREGYFREPERVLTAAEVETLETYEDRRLQHEPVSRICGSREFWGRDFLIGPAVLDPRPDTETLVDTALGILREERRNGEMLRILDLGTGSGCILLSLLAELPRAWGAGIDRSPEALAVARVNAERHGLADRAAFLCGDWCSSVNGAFDLIISNPPYISGEDIGALNPEVSRYDPLIALDGGRDGLDAYRNIAGEALPALKTGGWMMLEAGINQAGEIIQIFKDRGWQADDADLRICPDLAGINRVVAIKRQHRAG